MLNLSNALAAVAVFLGVSTSNALATSFTMTTEGPGSLGFSDTDTIKVTGEIGKVVSYSVYQADAEVPDQAKLDKSVTTYAASASEVWFECATRHYSIARLFFYDGHGTLVGSYDKPVLADQPVPPQTGVEEQFGYVCTGATVKNKISKFKSWETPLQALIRVSRATLHDRRYVP